ncbi:MAG: hypothetical protein FJX80_09840 [Bacteroidetes bacterium]|nr:hypothetical protein [Bacteroidota bacterium]
MQSYSKKPHSGVNFRTNKYRPKELRASNPPMSERESQAYGLYSQKPFHIDNLVDESLMDWDDLREIDLARDSRQHLERCWKLEKENAALKAENQSLRAELEMFKMQTSNTVPAHQMRAGGGAAVQVPAHQMRAGGRAAAQFHVHEMRVVFFDDEEYFRALRAGNRAVELVRRPQYDSCSDDEYFR